MNIPQLVEQAVENFLADQGLELVTNVYKGRENIQTAANSDTEEPTIALPCVIIEADQTFAVPYPGTGNYQGDLSIHVQADAEDTTDAEFHAMCNEVFGAFNVANLGSSLSTSLANFTCPLAYCLGISCAVKKEGKWINTLRFRIVACAADL